MGVSWRAGQSFLFVRPSVAHGFFGVFETFCPYIFATAHLSATWDVVCRTFFLCDIEILHPWQLVELFYHVFDDSLQTKSRSSRPKRKCGEKVGCKKCQSKENKKEEKKKKKWKRETESEKKDVAKINSKVRTDLQFCDISGGNKCLLFDTLICICLFLFFFFI